MAILVKYESARNFERVILPLLWLAQRANACEMGCSGQAYGRRLESQNGGQWGCSLGNHLLAVGRRLEMSTPVVGYTSPLRLVTSSAPRQS